MVMKNYPYYSHQKLSSFPEFLDYLVEKYGDAPALSFHQGEDLVKKSFRNFVADVRRLAAFFTENYHGKHLAVCGENSYNWLITSVAIVISGNTCVAIDKDADAELLKTLLKTADTDTLFYSEKYLDFVPEAKLKVKLERLEDTAERLAAGRELLRGADKPSSLAQSANKHSTKAQSTKSATRPAVIFFTSGTTGANKAVALSEKNILADLYGAASLYVPSGGTVSILPFHHSFGLVTAVLMPLYYGVETYICSSLKRFTKAMQLIHPDTIFVVPAFIEAFYRQIWRTARKNKQSNLLKFTLGLSSGLGQLSRKFGSPDAGRISFNPSRALSKKVLKEFGGELRHIICGGAMLDPVYVKWFRKLGINLLNGYGITECSPVLSVNRNDYYRDGSIGVPCRDTEIKIIDGEICARGDIVMLGYHEKGKIHPQQISPETGKVDPDNGYFHTGDLGYIDDGGFIFITGRAKDTIILSSGENISPETIETEFRKDKGVREVIAYAEGGEINVMIYPEEDRIGDGAHFESLRKKYNLGKPQSHQVSNVTLRTTEFPKNSARKILRSRIFN